MVKQSTLDGKKDYKVVTGLNISEACDLAYKILPDLQALIYEYEGSPENIELVGSIRRKKQIVNDVDFVCSIDKDKCWNELRKLITDVHGAIILRGANEQIASVLEIRDDIYIQVDFFRARSFNFGINKLIRTGSKEHNVWLATKAIKKGYRLSYSKGLMKDGVVIAGKTEESVFTTLGLSVAKPEDRELVNGIPLWLTEVI